MCTVCALPGGSVRGAGNMGWFRGWVESLIWTGSMRPPEVEQYEGIQVKIEETTWPAEYPAISEAQREPWRWIPCVCCGAPVPSEASFLRCLPCRQHCYPVYPVIREKRDPKGYRGPRPAPGQTVALCPTCNKFTLFAFTEEETVRCVECSFEVPRGDI